MALPSTQAIRRPLLLTDTNGRTGSSDTAFPQQQELPADPLTSPPPVQLFHSSSPGHYIPLFHRFEPGLW